ncbi:MAG: hypothetical protein ACXWPK_05680 [Isosphaeraceae bacterium]
MANAKDKGKETIHEGYDKAKEAGHNLKEKAADDGSARRRLGRSVHRERTLSLDRTALRLGRCRMQIN